MSASRAALWACRPFLRRWDVESSERVDYFIANSANVAAKINRFYAKEATVIYPPVDCDQFYIAKQQSSYYLIVSALVPYKRIDVAIAAFNQLKRPLKIVGDGPLSDRLAKVAADNIQFLGWVTQERLAALYAECQALIFPGEEDFGIVPLETQASGRPVIGYSRGGLLETVIPMNACGRVPAGECPTGIFFSEQTAESLIAAVELFERSKDAFDPTLISRHAASFSTERFKTQIRKFVDSRLSDWRK
jgi:glycosyltransferase involved in cell wall biosynthesis